MTDSQGEDVNEASAQTQDTSTGETDTSATQSSEGEQTDQQSQESSSTEDTEDLGGKFVPYERFREVNEKAKKAAELEKRLAELESKTVAPTGQPDNKEAIRGAIKEMGFMPKEEVQEMLRQKDDDDALKQELTRLESKYDGSDGKPKFDKSKVVRFALDKQIGDPEAAYKILHEKALVDWQIKQAIEKSQGIETETSTGTGAGVGVSNDDLKEAIKKGDKGALRTFLKRVNRAQ